MIWIRLGLVAVLLAIAPAGAAFAQAQLIPLPVSTEWRHGEFRLAADTVVDGRGKAARTAALLAKSLGLKTGTGGASRIRLMLVSEKLVAGEEAYRLTVAGGEVTIQASGPRGLFYGARRGSMPAVSRETPSTIWFTELPKMDPC